MKVLITGANGFVGSHLTKRLAEDISFRALVRTEASANQYNDAVVVDLCTCTDWDSVFRGIDVVVHCAARVHVMNESSQNPLKEFREVNVNSTNRLIDAAIKSGVSRFILISTVKVNGECTGDTPFLQSDSPNPSDPYAISKYESETSLIEKCRNSAMDYVIIRPPLIYGSGVKANFASMVRLAGTRVPLPIGGIKENRRSLVYVENLVDLISVCMRHSSALNQIFMVSDGEVVSTRELHIRIAKALGSEPRLFSVPPKLLVLIGKLTGKSEVVRRLCGSLEVDMAYTSHVLKWNPPFTMEQGLKATVQSSS